MSKSTTKYPEDEFDLLDPTDVPSGVHRAPRSVWSRLAPFVVVVAVCAVLGVGTVYYLAQSPSSPLNAGATPSTSTAPADPTDGATDVATPDPTDPATPEAPVEPPAEPEVPVEPETPVVDTSTAVRVLNATGRSGVAAGAAGTLTDAGWSDVVADNFTGTRPTSSLVYFKSSESEAAAREVAQLLGITDVVEAPKLVGPVSVILAGSFGR